MPSISSNYEKLRCRQCGSVFSEHGRTIPPCPYCGIIDYEWVTIQPVCDFCSTPLALGGECWTYPCKRFIYPVQVLPGTPEGSIGDWACCDECHNLIEADDRTALASRSVDKDIERHPDAAVERHALMGITRAMHDGFFKHRTGDAFREEVSDHD